MVEYFRKRNGACMKKKLSLKKFLSRRLAGGVLLLSNLSLVSIGFSAWSIGAVTTAEAEINVSAADLIELNKLFEIQTPRMFSYGSYGIIRDETIVSDGYVHFPVLINNQDANFKYVKKADNGDLNFNICITNAGAFKIFDDAYLKSTSDVANPITYGISADGFNDSSSSVSVYSKTADSVTSQISIPASSGYSDFKATYLDLAIHFTFDDFPSVYQSLVSNGLAFSIKMEVETI